jgi:hypothetical protein
MARVLSNGISTNAKAIGVISNYILITSINKFENTSGETLS